ncbi:MAG: type I DNA topoisomerase [Patescibacteria group bacterium]|nr:type I DNA topoisomerase [Patescibacteria group bacterium]
MALIIVESPTKARTFNRIFQGKNHYVFATLGHFRDLPKQRLAIDYENDFKPEYEIDPKKEKIVEKIISLSKEHEEVIIATDSDREGESIGYHVAFVLNKVNEKWPEISLRENHLKRIIFHEITEKAIREALENPQTLRIPLVKAQISRRILDRIVGYELSPVLWEKIGKKWLSAGRVQTVALRLVVEREKEIHQFKREKYYQIYGSFNFGPLKLKLVSKNGMNFEEKNTLSLFDGEYRYTKTLINEENCHLIIKDILDDRYQIEKIEETVGKKFPPPPLTTSLLQQEAFYILGFSAKTTMSIAQSLYENGLITYHRTDSYDLASAFVFKARDYIKSRFGESYLSEKPRAYKTKSRLAQEAHEAIRPTRLESSPKVNQMPINHKKLYQLIFNRALATQMREAEVLYQTIRVRSTKGYLFEGKTEKLVFDGFLKIFGNEVTSSQDKKPLLNIKTGEEVKLILAKEEEFWTKPPLRYHEASLIKTLEEKGIGRPSTYAPIITLIQMKSYLEKNGRYFVPSPLGIAISDYLSAKFPKIFSLEFTALMEEDLDKIAQEEKDIISVLREFYHPFSQIVKQVRIEKGRIEVKEENFGQCPQCQGKLVIKKSKFGKFIACANYPNCQFTKAYARILNNKHCPKCQGQISIHFSRTKKRYYRCQNYPKCDFQSWSLKDVQ